MDDMHQEWEDDFGDLFDQFPGKCQLCGRYMQTKMRIRTRFFPMPLVYDIWLWCRHCDVGQREKEELLAAGG